eukprot:gnl/TRDRNA2_/TRDRNA2_138531_c0_seq1.p1 gnl/TRDRNA2_/TRDRNA2_138531_c0~~gnl/TRDRNA2_/TRDRNA2_138531_c0_seq1.p1  ORF type:complete len:564 (-),score=48.68 gnl/TRDRNA2_/TRDRNA2_138531_c0_seq1:145-1713(-)
MQGYVDFFDFGRSLYDWAPVDMRSEIHLLVAHGDGSYAEPLALDPVDPSVHNLVQTGFETNRLFSVISTFNRIARTMPPEELVLSDGTATIEDSEDSRPTLCRLQEKVEQCAVQCGLADYVQVVMLPQVKCAAGTRRPSNSFVPSANRRQSNVSNSSLTDDSSFARQASRTPRTPVTAISLLNANVAPSSPTANTAVAVEAKLCLAFSYRVAGAQGRSCIDSYMTADPSAIDIVQATPSTTFTESHLLTSPITQLGLSEYLTWVLHKVPVGGLQEAPKKPRTNVFRRSCLNLFIRCTKTAWFQGSQTPMTVLLVLVFLVAMDWMLFFLQGSILMRLNPTVCAVWLLAMPGAQPLSAVVGVIFVLSEKPLLGRLFASLVVFSILNSTVSTVLRIGVLRDDSWFFDALELVTVCLLKFALWIVTNAHVLNLEAAHDMSFMDTPQDDFLGRILSEQNASLAMSNSQSDSPMLSATRPASPSNSHSLVLTLPPGELSPRSPGRTWNLGAMRQPSTDNMTNNSPSPF